MYLRVMEKNKVGAHLIYFFFYYNQLRGIYTKNVKLKFFVKFTFSENDY